MTPTDNARATDADLVMSNKLGTSGMKAEEHVSSANTLPQERTA